MTAQIRRSQGPAAEEFAFFHNVRVRWAEVDPQGIVYNANYLLYADIGMTEHMRALGYPYPALEAFGTDLFAVSASANFRSPAVYDDELRLGVRIAHLGRTSLRFEVGIFRQLDLLADVLLVYVNGDRETRVPTALPTAFIDRVLEFERLLPTRK